MRGIGPIPSLDAAFFESLDASFVVDLSTQRVLLANRAAGMLFGYRREEDFERCTFPSLFAAPRPMQDPLADLSVQGAAIRNQNFTHRDGSELLCDLTATILPSEDSPLALVNLRPALGGERALLDQLDRFAHEVSHELRNYATAIWGSAQILSDPDTEQEDRQVAARIVGEGLQSMLDAIDELVARTGASKKTGNPPVND